MDLDIAKTVKIGERWYAKRKTAMTLCEIEITDLTARTVEIKGLGTHDRKERYERGQIEFIEKMPLPKPPSDV